MKRERQTLQVAGRVISVTTDEVVLPNGQRAVLEIVHHPGGAAAVALDENRRVCLLRQYRYVADGWLWELPAGKLEPNEPALLTAQRPLNQVPRRSARARLNPRAPPSSPGPFTETHPLFPATTLAAATSAP